MLEVGQVLALRIRFNNSGAVSGAKHPYLIVSVDDMCVEVAQIDSLLGKEYKAAFRSNKTIMRDDPPETVIDRDSFVQLDNKFMLENYPDMEKFRRQTDKLSADKLAAVILAYNEYHERHHLDENKVVYMDQEELEKLNA